MWKELAAPLFLICELPGPGGGAASGAGPHWGTGLPQAFLGQGRGEFRGERVT